MIVRLHRDDIMLLHHNILTIQINTNRIYYYRLTLYYTYCALDGWVVNFQNINENSHPSKWKDA